LKSNFNNLVEIYDQLARLMFGNAMNYSQTVFLDLIGNKSHLLIVGGGTGTLLKYIDELELDLTVTFIELSPKMIDRAKKHEPFKHIQVNFIHANALNITLPTGDVIITNFFLDVFNEGKLKKIMQKLDSSLKTNGLWLCTDFVGTGRWHQDLLVKFMYLFFRMTTNLEGNRLLDFEKYFEELGFQKVRSKKYYAGMIEAACYSRTSL
jgi:tRNA (cmo5U34)-methyltransferase